MNIVCSLLLQLVQAMPNVPESLSQMYSEYKPGEPPSDLIKCVFRDIIKSSGETFLVIDALDECPKESGERRDLLDILTDIHAWGLPNLHVLVTSRNEPDIDMVLSPLITLPPTCIQTDRIQSDISLYVRSQLTKDPELAKWSKFPTISMEIEESLVKMLMECMSICDPKTYVKRAYAA